MTDSKTAQRLHEELAGCRQAEGFNRYPSELRDEAVAYARARRRAGVGLSQIAKELGVAITTADAWSKPEQGGAWRRGREDGARHSSDKLSLVPVVVRPEVSTRVLSRLEVDFGDGTRLQATGISADDLARAIQALRRPA